MPCSARGVEKLIFSSSAAVYGEPGVGLITEEAPTSPSNPYGSTKLAIDRDLSRRASAGDFAAVSLRYFNVAGAFGPYGERHRQETHLIPVALEVVAGVRKQLTIYGEDFPTPDGTCIRDYIHVVDLADAHILALEALQRWAPRDHQPRKRRGLLGAPGRRGRAARHRQSAADRDRGPPCRRPCDARRVEREGQSRTRLDSGKT